MIHSLWCRVGARGSDATAFHWFATTEVLDEFHRCLAESSLLILVWNDRDNRVPWVVDAHPGFTDYSYTEFPNPTPSTRQGLVDRIVPTPFVAALPDRELSEVRTQAAALAESLPESFDYPYLTRTWCSRRRA